MLKPQLRVAVKSRHAESIYEEELKMGKTRFKEVLERMKAEGARLDYRDAETLRYLYVVERLSTYEMAELLGVSRDTIRYWLRKYEIESRTISEAMERYPKIPFSGDPKEQKFMEGLCAGDIHAQKPREGSSVIIVSTTTTHPAMKKLVRDVWGVYGHYHEYPVFNPDTNQYEFGVASNLDAESFHSLEKKPTEVPKGDLFWAFLAGLGVSEGNWDIAEVDGYILLRFRLQTTNPELLKKVKERLEEEEFHPNFRLVSKAGTINKAGIRSVKDYYGVYVERRDEVVSLAEKLLPYSRHDEKVAWMKLIPEIKDEKYWTDVKDRVVALREKIDRETRECAKEAKEQYELKHRFRKVSPKL